jgi:hypothetical protein
MILRAAYGRDPARELEQRRGVAARERGRVQHALDRPTLANRRRVLVREVLVVVVGRVGRRRGRAARLLLFRAARPLLVSVRAHLVLLVREDVERPPRGEKFPLERVLLADGHERRGGRIDATRVHPPPTRRFFFPLVRAGGLLLRVYSALEASSVGRLLESRFLRVIIVGFVEHLVGGDERLVRQNPDGLREVETGRPGAPRVLEAPPAQRAPPRGRDRHRAVRLRHLLVRQARAFVPEQHRDFSSPGFLGEHLRRDARGDQRDAAPRASGGGDDERAVGERVEDRVVAGGAGEEPVRGAREAVRLLAQSGGGRGAFFSRRRGRLSV